jgi:hypothetical protein
MYSRHKFLGLSLRLSAFIFYSGTLVVYLTTLSTTQSTCSAVAFHARDALLKTSHKVRPCHSSCGYSLSSHRYDSGSSPCQVIWDFWCSRWHCGRFSPNTSVSCQFLFHRLLHTPHLPSGAGSQLVADIPSGLSLTPHQDTKKKKKGRTCQIFFGIRIMSKFAHKVRLH